MSKSFKYVSEFEFPSDKGFTGSCGESTKNYAKGGSCGCGGKVAKAKGGPVVERATGEKYPSREAMVRHESLETPRMQREEVVKRQVVKAPQLGKRREKAPLNAIAQAQQAPNIPGRTMMKKGGAAKSPAFQKKVSKVMGEFKAGDLHEGSKKGPEVKNPKQAIAIALSEARNATKKK